MYGSSMTIGNYIYLLTLIILAVSGYLCGAIWTMDIYRDKSFSPAKHKKKTGTAAPVTEDEEKSEEITDTYNHNNEVKNSLASRFTDQGVTYTDVVCNNENLDESKYVEKSRKRQTKGYNYLLKKSRNRK